MKFLPHVALLLVVLGTACGGSDSDSSAGPQTDPSWSTKSREEKCTASVEHTAELCDDEPEPVLINGCVDDYANYAPIGCESEFDAYVACMATEDSACSDADPCGEELDAVFGCNSAFAQRTGCSRTGTRDDGCPAESPYAILCLEAAPEGCINTVGYEYCCSDLGA